MEEMQPRLKPTGPMDQAYLERRTKVLQQLKADYALLSIKLQVLRTKNGEISQEIQSMISRNRALIERCLDACLPA